MSSLLCYVLFRRDLGLSPSRREVRLLARDLALLPKRRQRLACAVLAEVDGLSSRHAADKAPSEVPATIKGLQRAWRAEFAQWLRQRGSGGVCVVGNGANLLKAGLGPVIDAQAVVVRFNRFRGPSSTRADVGERIDVWVTAPGFDGTAPHGVPWVVVTGPEMSFRLQDWRRFEAPVRAGAKVLTVPLEPWRELVGQLQAPPSAGLLFLAWARSLLGSWTYVRVVGFKGVNDAGARYHHVAVNLAPATRHNWPAEQGVLQRWQQEGLNVESAD